MRTIDITIPSGQQESDAANIPKELSADGNVSYAIAAVIVPSGMTGAALEFLASDNGTDYYDVHTRNGTQLIITSVDTTPGYRTMKPSEMVGMDKVKLKSDSAEGADREITLVIRLYK